ncbi:recombinase family protein [Microbacterium sp. K27]|uniref:recombinase family protein n=1 Tax=Microbacterium sp. K27 TaxID=2305445 RepID=UPI00109B98B4|nr:recombinase family protein [Microbacterium sp. K27]
MSRTRRAVLYCRISRTTEESVSLQNQERELRRYAAEKGWDVVEPPIIDDGLSGTKERSNARRALDALSNGTADTLLTRSFDRWSRMGFRAVADLQDVLDATPGSLFVAATDGLRSDGQEWTMFVGFMATIGAAEAENTRKRVRAARAFHLSQTAPESQRFLGARAPFGYRAIKSPHGPGKVLIPDEYEAPIAREVADMLIAGATLADATKWLAENRVPTPQSEARRRRQNGIDLDAPDFDEPDTIKSGKGREQAFRGAWRATTVRNLWRSETLIGRTTRAEPILGPNGDPVLDEKNKPKMRDDVVRDASGLPITRWEPVLDADTFTRLQSRFKAPGREQPRRMVSWLTGVLYCQECGRRLYAHRRDRDDRDASYFRCAGVSDVLAPCPAPARVSFSRVEEYVESLFLGLAGDWPELERREFLESADVAQRLADVERALDDITAALRRDGADYPVLLANMDALKKQRLELQATPSTMRVETVPTGRSLRDIWDDTADDLRARRIVLSDVVERIYVARADSPGKPTPLDGEHVRIQWDSERVPTHDLDLLDESTLATPGAPSRLRIKL